MNIKRIDELHKQTKMLLRSQSSSEQHYEEALPYCKELYEAFSETNDFWDVHQYANCLKQLGNLDEAESICDNVYQQFGEIKLSKEQERPWGYIKKLYAWIIFEKYIKPLRNPDVQPDGAILINKTMILGRLIEQGEQGAPSMSFCILQVAKYIVKYGGNENNEKLLLLFAMIDEDQLSREARRFTDQSGKEREMASETEDYYRFKSKVLLKTNRFDECITCCSDAIEKVPQLHYNNDVWFERRIAQAFSGLGDIDRTLEKLNDLTIVSDKWFLLSEIGNCYYRKKEYNSALLYMLRAACTKDPVKMKVNLIESIGDVCLLVGDNDLAQINFLFAKSIREENGWFVKNQLKQKIKMEQVITFKDISKKWISKLYLLAGESTGKVSKIFPRNSGGFIQTDKGSYYFQSKNFLGKTDRLKVGDNVCFIIIDSYDKKKQKNTKEASVITPRNLHANF